jgi:hypothetical protein
VLELISLLETLVILFVPLYQPVLKIVLGLPRVLGGRRLRARGEEVFHCELAQVSTGMGVRIGAEMINADPIAFSSPILIDLFSVQHSLLYLLISLYVVLYRLLDLSQSFCCVFSSLERLDVFKQDYTQSFGPIVLFQRGLTRFDRFVPEVGHYENL